MQFDEAYFKSDEFQELLDSYETAVDSGSQPFLDADDLVDIADYYNYHGDYDKATEAIDYALQLYPRATLPNVFKAREALMRNNFKTARDYANQIEHRDDPDFHYLHAEILLAEGNIDQADQYLHAYGMTIDAEEYNDFIKDCANLYIDYGISDKAYEWMLQLQDDDSDDFKELMARTLFGLGKYKDSERIFNELIDSNPFSKYYWNALASAQYMDEDYAGSIASSEYAIAIDPSDPDALLSKANGLMRLNNYEEAHDYLKRYLEIIPDDEYALLSQGVCLVNQGLLQDALTPLNSALEKAGAASPYLAQIYQELAFCYSAMRQPQKAIEMLDKTKELACDHIDMLVIRGHILLENDLIEEAGRAFKQAILQSGNTPSVLLRVIVSLYDNHYVSACYLMFKKFFNFIRDYHEDYCDGYSYMALCCHDLGKGEEFLEYLRLAAEKNPDEARLVLGFMFPEGTEVKDYYDIMQYQLKKRE